MRVSRGTLIAAWLLLASAGDAQQGRGSAKPSNAHGAVVQPCRRMEFEGTVAAGQSFRRPIGAGLDFVLEAVPPGWVVRVLPSSGRRPEEDFAEVATPPFRSINPLLLTTEYGFRAQDVIGWNPRNFHYVATASAFAEAQRAYRAAMTSRVPTREQEMAVTHVVVRALEGRLEVLDAALVPGTADQTASAGLVSSHFASTAHTFRAPESGAAGAVGKVLSIRFRATLSVPEGRACEGSTKSTGNH